jgi:hypothetical protein
MKKKVNTVHINEMERLNKFNSDLIEENNRLHNALTASIDREAKDTGPQDAKVELTPQYHFNDNFKTGAIGGYKEQETTFSGGAKRKVISECSHLICPELMRRVGLIYTEGLNSYPDKSVTHYAQISTARFGLPLDNLLRHLDNHYLRYRHGDTSEDNLAKIAWAIQQIMHQEDSSCQHYNMFLKHEDRTIKPNTLYVG